MATFELLQGVELTEDIPEWNVQAGTVATIILVFGAPGEPEAYEIEIVGKDGSTVAEFAVTPGQIRPLATDGCGHSE